MNLSSIYSSLPTTKSKQRGRINTKKLVKVYRNKNLIINVYGRGVKDVASIEDYLEAKK